MTTTRCGIAALLTMVGAACASSGAARPTAASIERDRATLQATATRLLDPFHLGIQRWSIETRVEPPHEYELSLYTEPAQTQTAEVYAQRFAPLAAAVVPALFERYPDVGWIDLCQEQAGVSGGAWEPTPVTRLALSRAAADAIDWSRAGTATLLARNRTDAEHVQIETHFGVERTSSWRAAAAEARGPGG